MPKVTFLPANETFEFESGKLPYKGHGLPESLLDVAMNNHFHLEHACGGNCACTTCHVVVKEGKDNLSEMDDADAKRLAAASTTSIAPTHAQAGGVLNLSIACAASRERASTAVAREAASREAGT